MKIIDVVIRASFDKRTKWGPEFPGFIYGLKIQISENRAIAGRSKTKRCRMPWQRYFKTCAILVPQSEEKNSTRETSLEGISIIAEIVKFIYLQKKELVNTSFANNEQIVNYST